MKRFLSALVLLWAVSAFGAVVYKSATIEPLGMTLNIVLAPEGTNGDFNFGFGANFSGASAIVLSISSQWYDDLGNAVTLTENSYVTKQMRMAYPNNALNDVTNTTGSDTTIRLAISRPIFSGDTVTVTASANWYSNNVPATNVMAVVNNSTLAHPKCIANWSWLGYQCIQSNTMPLRVVAFHRSGRQGRPVRVVKFTVQDQHSHTATAFVTTLTIDRSIPDAVPICEYVASMDISGMTALDQLRCDFKVFPWVGDSGAILDTSDGVNNGLTGNYGPITNLCDRSLTYGTAFAVVSTTNNAGSDGVVSKTFSAGSPPLAFDTIAHAYSAMVASNSSASWYSRNDAGAGWIYLRETTTSHDWTGAGAATGNTPATWVNIAAYPGAVQTNCWVGSQSTAFELKGREHFYGLYLSNSAAIFVYSPTVTHAAWFDQCRIYLTGGNAFDMPRNYWTDCVVDRNKQGFKLVNGDNSYPVLVRGNVIHLVDAQSDCYTIIGNCHPTEDGDGSAVFQAIDSRQNYSGQASQTPIFAFNRIMSHVVAGGNVLAYVGYSNNLGVATVQNAFECTTNTGGTHLLSYYEGAFSQTNSLFWNNTSVGQGIDYAYNETLNPTFLLFSLKNNLLDSLSCKTDIFSTGDKSRTNNWWCINGVDQSGNYVANITNALAGTGFQFWSPGLNCFQMPSGGLNIGSYLQYILAACYDGTNPGKGNGDYKLQYSSPAYTVVQEQLLPFDIEGRPRSLNDPPGAFAFRPVTILTIGATTKLQPGTTTKLQP